MKTFFTSALLLGLAVLCPAAEKAVTGAPVDCTIHQIAVNQVGYEPGWPMRFTAPLSPDGSRFEVRPAKGTAALFRGTIQKGVGDFSAFRPPAGSGDFVIAVSGGSLKPGVSDPFLIAPNLFRAKFWQPAVDFLIDVRSVVGTHPSAFGGCPWRDGTYYDFVVPSLVLFNQADPAVVATMPRQIDWEADKAKVMDPAFKFDAKNPCSDGVMEAVRKYYTEIEPPKADAPDVSKLIHWGLGYYLVNPATKDPSSDPDGRRIHSQTLEQFAYLLAYWPAFEKWLPKSFYEKCRDFAFANWEKSGCLGIDKWWAADTYMLPEQLGDKSQWGGKMHPFKGRHAPGHSIVPNLLMHEVAKREGRPDAGIYLKAAVAQADWVIKNVDWNDPRTTKGQRMSEHRTIPNLVWLLQRYPNDAPPGLREKITEWAKVAVARSDNFWDFRRYDLDKHWTIPTLNETGNLAGFPACALSASWVVQDKALKQRLREIGIAHLDNLFGRNPRLAAAPHHPEMGFPDVERGWPVGHKNNTCARLELCRGSLSSSPGTEMYPFNPEGEFRHREGWVNYGAAWCVTLSYLAFDSAAVTAPLPK